MPGSRSRPWIADEVVERLRLADALRHVRRERRRRLADALRARGRSATCLIDSTTPCVLGTSSASRSQPVVRAEVTNHFACFAPMSRVDPLLDRLGAELGDRIARIDALRAAFVAEVAAGALPDSVFAADCLEPLGLLRVARIADEPHRLRERLRPEELRARLHGVALGDAAAAVDAERLLVNDVHPRLRDQVLLARRRRRARATGMA